MFKLLLFQVSSVVSIVLQWLMSPAVIEPVAMPDVFLMSAAKSVADECGSGEVESFSCRCRWYYGHRRPVESGRDAKEGALDDLSVY